MTNTLENNLTEGNVAKQLVRYALPLVLTSLLQSLYSISDTIIAGRFIGASALSAINNAGLITNVVTQIVIAFTIGGNILIGQYYGAKEEKNRKAASGTLFSICILSGVIFSAALFIFARPIMQALGAPAFHEAVKYLQVCAGGIVFIFAYNALSSILRAIGNSRKPLLFIIIAVSMNVVLDLFFVAVLGWGVKGAAFATVLSQFTAFASAFIFCLRQRGYLGMTMQFIRIQKEKVLRILKIGFPLILQWMAASISWITIAFLINKYGVECSAGNGISNRIKELCQLFITAMTSAAATMIAQNLGANLYERAYAVMKTCMKITLLMAVIMIIFVQLLGPQMVSVFTDDLQTHGWAVRNLRIEIFAQVFYAGFLTFNTLPTSSGHTMFVMWNSFVNCIVVRIVLAVILERFMGAEGVFWACAIAPAVSVPIGCWFAKSGRWKQNLAKG